MTTTFGPNAGVAAFAPPANARNTAAVTRPRTPSLLAMRHPQGRVETSSCSPRRSATGTLTGILRAVPEKREPARFSSVVSDRGGGGANAQAGDVQQGRARRDARGRP